MQIGSFSVNFGASIPNTSAAKELQSLFELSKNCDYVLKPTKYSDLCKKINRIFPAKTDEVIFNQCDNKFGNGNGYTVSGSVIHNNRQKSFSTRVYPLGGSIIMGNDIIKAIENTLNNKRSTNK